MINTNNFLKPELNISTKSEPFIIDYILSDYKKVNTLEEFIVFMHKYIEEIQTTKNDVKKATYTRVIYTLFSMITDKSYQSLIGGLIAAPRTAQMEVDAVFFLTEKSN